MKLEIKRFFYYDFGEILAQISQRHANCFMPGNCQDEVGWGSQQTDLANDAPVYSKEDGREEL